MMISLYSFLMAILWFNVFILVGTFLQRKTDLVLCGRFAPLLILLALTIFRLVVPVEVSFTKVVNVTGIYPTIQASFRSPWLMVGTNEISGEGVLVGLWLIGAAIMFVRFFLHVYRDYCEIEKMSVIESPKVELCVKMLESRFKCAKRIKVVVSPNVPTPVLIGMIKPTILLPCDCLYLTDQEIKYILAHELTHFIHGDIWIKLLTQCICCLLWWDPFVYLLQKDLESVLEYKCDLEVTKPMREKEKVIYLQTILDILLKMEMRWTEQPVKIHFCGVPEATVLKRRFQLVLKQGHTGKRVPLPFFVAGALSLFILSYSIVLQPASEPPVCDLVDEIMLTPENAYILADSDGACYLICDGEKLEMVPPENLQDMPYCLLTIRNMTGGKE